MFLQDFFLSSLSAVSSCTRGKKENGQVSFHLQFFPFSLLATSKASKWCPVHVPPCLNDQCSFFSSTPPPAYHPFVLGVCCWTFCFNWTHFTREKNSYSLAVVQQARNFQETRGSGGSGKFSGWDLQVVIYWFHKTCWSTYKRRRRDLCGLVGTGEMPMPCFALLWNSGTRLWNFQGYTANLKV